MKNILLGVSGSISAYRAADLARDLMREGFEVRVCLTDAAQQFVTPILFETLTGNPCLTDTFDEPVAGRMAHIDWARWADILLIAPATANTMNSLAQGLAVDMLTSIAVVFQGLLIVAPAMNPSMFADETVQTSVDALSRRGAVIIGPTEGDVASGEFGPGKLAPNSVLVEEVLAWSSLGDQLSHKKVIVTGGPTREPLDDVRFLSNRSSGKMAVALARVAQALGGEVTLILGPSSLPVASLHTDHGTLDVIRVETAADMLAAVSQCGPTADWIVGAAAVADYRPAHPHKGKMRRSNEDFTLQLTPNPDIIAHAASIKKAIAKVIGFAAEPSSDLEIARAKLERKGLDAIASNDVSQPGIGFDSDQNELTLVWKDGRTANSGLRSKTGCAVWFWQQLLD